MDDKGRPIKISASTWLDQHRPVEQMTWAPGGNMLIKKNGVHTFTLYRSPIVEPGDPNVIGAGG